MNPTHLFTLYLESSNTFRMVIREVLGGLNLRDFRPTCRIGASATKSIKSRSFRKLSEDFLSKGQKAEGGGGDPPPPGRYDKKDEKTLK